MGFSRGRWGIRGCGVMSLSPISAVDPLLMSNVQSGSFRLEVQVFDSCFTAGFDLYDGPVQRCYPKKNNVAFYSFSIETYFASWRENHTRPKRKMVLGPSAS